jgi:hypothetical protein
MPKADSRPSTTGRQAPTATNVIDITAYRAKRQAPPETFASLVATALQLAKEQSQATAELRQSLTAPPIDEADDETKWAKRGSPAERAAVQRAVGYRLRWMEYRHDEKVLQGHIDNDREVRPGPMLLKRRAAWARRMAELHASKRLMVEKACAVRPDGCEVRGQLRGFTEQIEMMPSVEDDASLRLIRGRFTTIPDKILNSGGRS